MERQYGAHDQRCDGVPPLQNAPAVQLERISSGRGAGFFVAMAVIFNLLLAAEPVHKAVASAVLLVGWLVFFPGI